MATKSKAASLADQYGFSQAFFNSDPALKSLLAQAVKGNWTTDKFIAEFRDTGWFKHHGATYRQNLAQKTSDPATWNVRLAQTIASLTDQAHKVGAVMSSDQIRTLADHALLSGYSDAQIQNSLSSYVKLQGGQYFGEAGTNALTLNQLAWRNGMKLSDSSLNNWVRQIAAGDRTTDDFGNWVRTQAASLAPGVADQLKGGMDLYDVAQPYMQSMSQILEVPTTDIDLFDPKIRGALNSKGTDGKVGTMSLGDFAQSLRNDPRWRRTNNARDSFAQTAHSILSSFGFTS